MILVTMTIYLRPYDFSMATASIDRRRNNGPANSYPPVFESAEEEEGGKVRMERDDDIGDKFFLRTRLVGKANGSAYFEKGALKILVSVQGPRPALKPSGSGSGTGYSPSASVSVDFKYAPFACAAERHGYVKTSRERVLGAWLATSITPSILVSRYPKSEIAIYVMVLEEAQTLNEHAPEEADEAETIAGCVTATSAALADAGIEVCDLVAGAAVLSSKEDGGSGGIVLGYMPNRETVTMLHSTLKQGDKKRVEALVNQAVQKAKLVNLAVCKTLLLD